MKNIYRAGLIAVFGLCGFATAAPAQVVNGLVAQRVIEYDWMRVMRHRQDQLPDNEDGYRRTSIKNLSKLYWAIGMEDPGDDTAIEQYLFINECDLFNRARGTPEWRSIKGATRSMLCRKKSDFPTRFEAEIPFLLGKYDKATNQYEVGGQSVMDAVNRIDIAPNQNIEVCNSSEELLAYPANFILVLDRPFTFKTIPASPELAEYARALQATSKDAPSKTPLYLRLKIGIDDFDKPTQIDGHPRAVLKGGIDGYEIYADEDETRLLFAIDLPKRAYKKKVADAVPVRAADDNAEPAGGGLGDLYKSEEGADETTPAAALSGDDGCMGGKGDLPF
jgi:hypothetical protein